MVRERHKTIGLIGKNNTNLVPRVSIVVDKEVETTVIARLGSLRKRYFKL